MRRRQTRRRWVAGGLIVAAGLALLFYSMRSAAQGQSSDQNPNAPSSQGPASQPGSEVYRPQKSAPPKPKEEQIERINPASIYTLKTKSNLVNVNVLVTDNDGDPISNLGEKNFELYDDGVKQPITNFSTAAAPITVELLVEFDSRWWTYTGLATEDAYEFARFMRPKDWVAVVSFGMRVHLLQDFTHNPDAVRAAIQSLQIPGFRESNLYDALAWSENRMQSIQGRKAIVVVCSGVDTFSKLTYPQMLKIAKASETPIYAVSTLEWLYIRGYVPDMTEIMTENQLRYITTDSGGTAYFPRFEGAIPDIYHQINSRLRREYSLGFIPADTTHSGKYHKLRVKLVNAEGNPLRIVNQKGKLVKYRIVAREGYYAPKG